MRMLLFCETFAILLSSSTQAKWVPLSLGGVQSTPPEAASRPGHDVPGAVVVAVVAVGVVLVEKQVIPDVARVRMDAAPDASIVPNTAVEALSRGILRKAPKQPQHAAKLQHLDRR